MKIIHIGNPDTERPEWIGRQLTCAFCATTVELELGDDVSMTQESRNGIKTIHVSCPLCKCLINQRLV